MLTAPFPPTRQDHREIQLSKKRVNEWLISAYSEQEANVAMALPVDLRNELYSDVLLYGPAADQIRDFFNTLIASNQVGSSIHLGNLMSVEDEQDPKWYDLSEMLINWARAENHFSTYNRFSPLWTSYIRPLKTVISLQAFKGVCWMLNGQYVFDEGMALAALPYEGKVNEILAIVGLEPLGGIFADQDALNEWVQQR